MMTIDRDMKNRVNETPSYTRKFPLGPITAGVLVGLGIQLVFNLLGLGVGVIAFNGDSSDVAVRGIGFIAWVLLSGIVAMFLGGWVTGIFGFYKDSFRNAIAGGVVWGAATLITFVLTFGMAGVLVNTTLNSAKQALVVLEQDNALSQKTHQSSETAKNSSSSLTQGDETKDKTTATTENILNTLGTTALSTALAFILSAFSAMLGSMLGGKRRQR